MESIFLLLGISNFYSYIGFFSAKINLNVKIFGNTDNPKTNAKAGFHLLLNTKNPKTTLLLTIPEIIKPKLNKTPTKKEMKQSPTLLAA